MVLLTIIMLALMEKIYQVVMTKQFWYKIIWKNKKLTTKQGEDCHTGCLLDYHYIKLLKINCSWFK